MRIRNRLYLSAIISIALVLALGAVLFDAVSEMRKEDAKEEMAMGLLKNIYERATLRDEYLFRHEERSKIQWQAKRERFERLLAQAEDRFDNPDEKAILREIHENYEAGKSLSKSIVANRENTGANGKEAAFAHEAEKRLASQLLIRSYNMLADALRLKEMSNKALASAQRRALSLAIVFILVVVATVAVGSFSMSRLITGRIRKLQEGAEIIAAGNLDFKLGLPGKDELGDLAASFDRMAGRLKESHTSVENLRKEVAERRRTSEALREAGRFSQQIIDNAEEGVIVHGRDLRFQVWNPFMEKLSGLAASAVQGKHPLELFPFLRGAGVIERLERALNGEPSSVLEFPFHYPLSGRSGWLSDTYASLRNANGEIIGVIATVRDITKRKRAEEEVRKLNAELEERVKERTAQLEAANQELESFSYSVSHDLRAPLRHLMGFVELLNKKQPGSLDEKSAHYLKVISDAARHMGQLVDDLLSFSRMGRVDLMRSRVGLDRVVKDAVQGLQEDTQGRDIKWKIEPLPELNGDPAMLQLVFVNLISNALKFTRPRKQAVIEIGSAAENGEVVFYIKDNGVGFDPRYAERLFALFSRLHKPDEFEGTGVGLANVRRIIHRHGGRTWATGAADQGATFYFSLPRLIGS